MSTGVIKKVAGPLVIAEGMRDVNMFDVVRVSNQRLIGEIIEMHGDEASIQVYEDTSSEADELKEKGTEKLRELMNGSSFAMDVATLDIDVEIGDIVGGRDYITGIYAKKPVSKKVYRIEGGEASMEYGIEGED